MSHKAILKLIVVMSLAGCTSTPSVPPTVQPTGQTAPQTKPLGGAYQEPDYNGQGTADDSFSAPSVSGDYAGYPSVQHFIQYMVTKHGFSRSYLNGLFSKAQRLESVIALESPVEPSNVPSKPHRGSWTRYRNKFLTEEHISSGVEFWRAHADALDRASEKFGVDPEYIVGIIGVETYFGKNIGKTCIFDALTTLAFDTPRRGKYFASELENFLLMTREEGFAPRQPVGSWAGAMGLGQFMPSSFRRLAIDFDDDGRRNIWDPEDAIGSVAHYFSRNGWKFNQPVTSESYPANDPAVIELSTYEGSEYWRVYNNFKVIKRYNNSNKYAMAVHQLAQAIKQRH